jgi:hypothetical protein
LPGEEVRMEAGPNTYRPAPIRSEASSGTKDKDARFDEVNYDTAIDV